MATYSKQLLSASSQGQPIIVSATASTGNLIHTTNVSSTVIDEVWLYAYNSSASSTLLTIQQGGIISPNNDIKLSIPAQSGLTLVVPGLILTGTGSTGSSIYAYAATTSVITISGYVNRIS
jgi:hypothetical protein